MWAVTFGIVELAEVVLERRDPGDEQRRLRAERLTDELERVAEPLAGDPELVERLDVGPAQDRLVRPHALVRGEDPRRGRVADAVRLGGRDRQHREALVSDELAVVVDPAPVAVGVELANQQLPGVVAVIPPATQQRLQRSLLRLRQVSAVGVGGLEQNVEIADGAEPGGDFPKPLAMSPRPAGPERLAEDAPRRSLAPRRDPHPVQFLGVAAVARAGLASEHSGEVEAKDLAAGLGQVVVGEHAGGLAGDQAGLPGFGLGHLPRLGPGLWPMAAAASRARAQLPARAPAARRPGVQRCRARALQQLPARVATSRSRWLDPPRTRARCRAR